MGKHKSPKKIIAIDARHDGHHRFKSGSVSGAIYSHAINMRPNSSATVSLLIGRGGEEYDHLEMARFVQHIHRVTKMRLRVSQDPYQIATALLRRLPNAPKSDATSDKGEA